MAGAVVESRGHNYCQIQFGSYDRNLIISWILVRCVKNALKIRAVEFGFLLFFVATASMLHLSSDKH